MLHNKKVLLGVTASIAAYKATYLVRLFIKAGAEVRVILTESAKDFVTPLTLSTLSKNPVYSEYFNGKTGGWNSHVELAEWADIFVIAPLSANTMAKMVQGICDNLLLATYLSARCPVFFAPAMDLEMYQKPIVQENIESLQMMGHILIPAGSGELASGLEGEGRMEEPENIIKQIEQYSIPDNSLKGKKILISAGPTREYLDPVRYISNHSSGKMGVSLAIEASRRGGEVTLVHGPIKLKTPPSVKAHPVVSADEMFEACMKYFPESDVIVMSAAVADYKPAQLAVSKIKKSDSDFSLALVKNRDILKTMGESKKEGQYLVGFALETENERENANKKLVSKKLDMIVLNSLKDEGAGFDHSTNKVTLIKRSGAMLELPLKSKSEVARDILNDICRTLI
ncbi:MAG TPA: bifunctional phosphopantothenoylcysteine decarboxylase/phosphopantothenate--cysteine ligase CoaBC [Flavobacteriales bacterium]|nr:bifunctional phosphopantothenoylcysteine decarboxylase/phosphopantothenate--cysteine ligase CoaBC [Flavobacteriales bacterium]